MKKTTLGFTTLLLLSAFACKKEISKTGTIVRDCTGTYLRFNNLDYQVCNLEKVTSFTNGQTVSASFKMLKDCTGSANNSIVCYMYHKNEGWIEISKIN